MYILRALDQNGSEFFYTGQGGKGWVHENFRNAIGYSNLDGARRKASIFNKWTELNGLRWIAVCKAAYFCRHDN